MRKSVGIIGAGFSGLAAASCLARENFKVSVFEKNSAAGGRARKFESAGFMFDMGPSWYWMPDVFEKFFNIFGKTSADYYSLVRLDPSYRIYYGKDDYMDVPSGPEAVGQMFEKLESGSSEKLKRFLVEARYKYEIGMHDLVYKPGLSIRELLDLKLIRGALHLHVFQSIAAYIRKFFRNERIIQMLEFPVLFLGATPADTPALYSLMNYADISLGTWYPVGGMYRIIDAMVSLAKSLGVEIYTDSPVDRLSVDDGKVNGLYNGSQFVPQDYVVASADYHHVEQHLLPERYRRYDKAYWDSRTLAPSSLLFYLGIGKKLDRLQHHNLFFDQDFTKHSEEIYKSPRWPTAPQFYVSCPSRTDHSVAPAGCENLMILIPVAPGLIDEPAIRNQYFDLVVDRLESVAGERIRDHIIFKRSYAHNDFIADYNAFRGNAYGLANTLSQTANLRPSIVNKIVPNLFYTGQLTVPGPGMPPSLISGQVVAAELIKRATR